MDSLQDAFNNLALKYKMLGAHIMTLGNGVRYIIDKETVFIFVPNIKNVSVDPEIVAESFDEISKVVVIGGGDKVKSIKNIGALFGECDNNKHTECIDLTNLYLPEDCEIAEVIHLDLTYVDCEAKSNFNRDYDFDKDIVPAYLNLHGILNDSFIDESFFLSIKATDKRLVDDLLYSTLVNKAYYAVSNHTEFTDHTSIQEFLSSDYTTITYSIKNLTYHIYTAKHIAYSNMFPTPNIEIGIYKGATKFVELVLPYSESEDTIILKMSTINENCKPECFNLTEYNRFLDIHNNMSPFEYYTVNMPKYFYGAP